MPLLPDFLVIGAMKAGTTSLFHYLRSHPGVFLAEGKELDFFVDDDARGGNWTKGLEWYSAQFEGSASAEVRGEVSPNYTKYPMLDGVPARIRDVLGADVKLVYALRDPLARLKSHWSHTQSVWGAGQPLEEAARSGHLRDCSNYALQLRQYLDVFSREQVLVVTSEELADESAVVVDRVLRFLGVRDPSAAADVTGRHHESDKKPFPRFGWRAARAYQWSTEGATPGRRLVRAAVARRLERSDLDLDPAVAAAVRAEMRAEVDELQRLVDVDVSRWQLD